tara:strand:+ start:81 stop:560 length:480 start_codon:yes stop_codon:yes gene_type:complete
MIIQCINCLKKFDVDSSLIPDSGRQIQCGSCNHIWFFKKKEITSEKKIDESALTDKIDKIKISNLESDEYEINKLKDLEKNNQQKRKNLLNKKSKKSIFSIRYVISVLIVLIITFVGIIIVLDTFKLPLIDLFPGLELMLFNLFETLKDIFLFTKNLIL